MNECCGTCMFYHAVDNEHGECREAPPKIFVVPTRTMQGDGLGFSSQVPAVIPSFWCGAFDPGNTSSGEKSDTVN